MKGRVVITGMGTVNPLGHDVEGTWTAMLAGKSGITPIELFDAVTYPTRFAAQVKGFDLASQVPDAARHANAGRHCRFALGAAVQAWRQSGLDRCELDRRRLAIYLGSGEGNIDYAAANSLMIDAWKGTPTDGALDKRAWAALAFTRHDLYREVEQEANMVVAHLAAEFGVRGPAVNVLTACAASTQALGDAAGRIPAAAMTGAMGSLFAGAGGVELAVASMALKTGIVPPTVNFASPAKGCELNLSPQARRADIKHVVTGAFAVGGQSAACVLRHYEG